MNRTIAIGIAMLLSGGLLLQGPLTVQAAEKKVKAQKGQTKNTTENKLWVATVMPPSKKPKKIKQR